MYYQREDIEDVLRSVGVRQGDILFVTTGLGMLGIAKGVESPDELNKLFFDVLKEVVGDTGTILVPTYSYTFGRSYQHELAEYNPTLTPSKIGPFPDFFRRQLGVVRSSDPMMSVAGYGPACASLFADLPATSYGHGSLYARLLECGTKCLNIGLGPNWTAFIHHADFLSKVPFRYDKLFWGQTLDAEGEVHTQSWVYSVPILCPEARANAHKLGRLAEAAGIWSCHQLGRGRVYLANYRDYFDFAMKLLAKDPWLMATGPAADVIILERQRVGQMYSDLQCDPIQPRDHWLEQMNSLQRDTVSDGMDKAFSWLCTLMEFKESQYVTGENCFDWIVPERWRGESACIIDDHGDTLLSTEDGSLLIGEYCLSFDGDISGELLRQIMTNKPGIGERNPFNFRGLRLKSQCIERIQDDKSYHLNVSASFSFGQMHTAEYVIPGDTDDAILLVVPINGDAGDSTSLSPLTFALKLIDYYKAQPIQLTLIILVVPGEIGLAAWLAKNIALSKKILAACYIESVKDSSGGWAQDLCLERDEHLLVSLLTKEWGPASPSVLQRWQGGNPVASNFEWPCSIYRISFPEQTSYSVLKQNSFINIIDAILR